jgi:hypothetical protein
MFRVVLRLLLSASVVSAFIHLVIDDATKGYSLEVPFPVCRAPIYLKALLVSNG